MNKLFLHFFVTTFFFCIYSMDKEFGGIYIPKCFRSAFPDEKAKQAIQLGDVVLCPYLDCDESFRPKEDKDLISVISSHIVFSQKHNPRGFQLLQEFIAPTLATIGMEPNDSPVISAKNHVVSHASVKIRCMTLCGYECFVKNNDNASYLLTRLLLHHNLTHYQEKYREVKQYFTDNALEKASFFEFKCPKCSEVLLASDKQLLLNDFIWHLTTQKHNKDGFFKALSYVKRYQEYC